MPFSLSPEQKESAFWLALGLAFLALLLALGPVLTPFIAAAILAYALNGAVDYLDHLHVRGIGVPRTLAVSVVISGFLAAILALVLIVVPVLNAEIPLLQAQIPQFLQRLNDFLAPRLGALGIHVQLDGSGLRELMTQHLAGGSEEIWGAVLRSVKTGGSAVMGWIGTLILVPVLLFYLLLDWHHLLNKIAGAVPRRWLKPATAMGREVNSLLAQYLRGQLLVMLVLAVYYSAGLMLAGFDVALPVGILTGLLVFIPYLGYGIGLALALIAAVLQFSSWHGLVAVAIIYGGGQVLESFYLTPRLVGERIGMNPLAVIFALMAFGQLFGFAGVLLALPASAVLLVAGRHLRRHYLASSFYNRAP
ncbi:AI-2E family transporter [Massilia sp. TS11]|uniref:AI-2E family transporter n=1 Tax=Massilia sp. TS11 TaxID=2908003 RepID=UPI001ED9D640|nr:AI-2E family transporter [Massilia sp. TS11]MCG2586462.1 AI-2E family transporter [Massilia sp. TS11]